MDRRMEDMEVRVAFLEKGLADLDEVIGEVANKMDLIHQELQQLKDHVRTDEVTVRGDPIDEVPPHY